eukprot:TRINITY_DN4469_c0_g1_i1.p1 TRINITY_DN4469_c0_g1~~TRINITY_DN4469_c0_g1_i1.p1  ORF type:complete len:242 (-),score=64.84 TRINITY_DN4469_c0_g1_i1:348-1013(-)
MSTTQDLSLFLSNATVTVLGNEKAQKLDIDYLFSIVSPLGDRFEELTSTSVALITPLLVELQIEENQCLNTIKKIMTEARKQKLLAEIRPLPESEDTSSSSEEERPVSRKEDYEPEFQEFLQETWSDNPVVRKRALRDICPCRIKQNVEEFWRRIIEMADDENPVVRYQAMHNLCDGSPNSMEEEVLRVLEKLHYDSDKKIRRQCHRVLSNYRRTGKWNIL